MGLTRMVGGLRTDIKLVIGTPTLFESRFDLLARTCENFEDSQFLEDNELKYGQVLRSDQFSGIPEVFNSLETLRVETSSMCSNISLPNLAQLCVIFSTSIEEEVPIVENITAPKLSQFVVHYNRLPPLFKGIDVGGEASTHEKKQFCNLEHDLRNRTFELAHIPSLQLDRQPYHYLSSWNQTLYDSTDMSFTKNYSVHNYTGVPTSLVRSACLSEVGILRWHLSGCSWDNYEDPLYLPEVVELLIYMNEKETKIPLLRECTKLQILQVNALELNADISSIWSAEFPSLEYFSLHQAYHSLVGFPEFERCSIEVSNEDWEMLIKSAAPQLSNVRLSGFQMPFLSASSGRAEPSTKYFGICLSPVIPKGQTEFMVEIPTPELAAEIIHTVYFNDVLIFIEPVFEDARDRGKARLVIKGELQGQVKQVTFSTPSKDWSDVVVGGHKLLKYGLAPEIGNEPVSDTWVIPF